MTLNAIPIEVTSVVIVASAVAALTDVWRFQVYNLLTFPLLFAGVIYHATAGGWGGLALSAAGIAFGLAVFAIPYLMGGMGAGDMKFVAALGAWLGITPMTVIVFFWLPGNGYLQPDARLPHGRFSPALVQFAIDCSSSCRCGQVVGAGRQDGTHP